jgi:hypothetical protein
MIVILTSISDNKNSELPAENTDSLFPHKSAPPIPPPKHMRKKPTYPPKKGGARFFLSFFSLSAPYLNKWRNGEMDEVRWAGWCE